MTTQYDNAGRQEGRNVAATNGTAVDKIAFAILCRLKIGRVDGVGKRGTVQGRQTDHHTVVGTFKVDGDNESQ